MVRKTKSTRGAILVTTLVFVFIVSLVLAGAATLTASHYTRATVDRNYAAALYAAEAGANYEMRKISENTANADQAGVGTTPGVAYTYPGGAFTVYCENKNGSTPWVSGQYLTIVSTGNVNGVVRTVNVAVRGYNPPGNFAIYTMSGVSVWHGSAMDVVGDVGTNGDLDFSGHPGIQGSIYFNGPNAGWEGGSDPGGYTENVSPTAIGWETVDQKALDLFPAATYAPGGLAYLATHNDNAKATPPITSNSISSAVTLNGPGNYYVTSVSLNGNKTITLNNTGGPINLWVGPDGGSGTCTFRGGTAAVSMATNPADACHIYVATASGINLAGNEEIDAGIYAYNVNASGNPYGPIQVSGNPTIDGQVLGDTVDINGNVTVNYVAGLMQPSTFGYYGFDNSWVEVNGAH